MLLIVLDNVIIYLILFELILYTIKYWKFNRCFFKNRRINEFIFGYGITICFSEIQTNKTETEIVSFIKDNIKPYKIVNKTVYLRRRYLKWIQWSTPVPVQGILKFKQTNGTLVINCIIKSIYTPWLILVYFGIIRRAILNEPIFSIVNVALFSLLIFIGLALIEKNALYTKIKNIAELNIKYNYFA